MGNSSNSILQINYEDIQTCLSNSSGNSYILLNTLPTSQQTCLIQSTLPYEKEEAVINHLLKLSTYSQKNIIIYGKNCNDESVNKKYYQLLSLGFSNVYIYRGGLFEWLLLQDIYGTDLFPTTSKELDILKFKSVSLLNRQSIMM